MLDENDDDLVVAMADPQDDYLVDALRLCSGKNVVPRIGVPSEIEAALDLLCSQSREAGPGAADSAQFLDDETANNALLWGGKQVLGQNAQIRMNSQQPGRYAERQV